MALIFALFFLKESNPEVLARRRGEKKEEEKPKEEKPKEEKKPKVKVHFTLTMVLCFIFEFCVRWDVNIFNSRYGIYLNEKFNTSSAAFSSSLLPPLTSRTLLVCGCVWNLFEQLILYPFIVSKLGVPIPWISFIGMLINACGFFFMASDNQYVAIGAAFLFWIGYCFVSPTSASILSVGSSRQSDD